MINTRNEMIDPNRMILVSLPRVALVLFILMISLAMFAYPGGTYRDISTQGYIFSQNFLSDLGRWSAWNEEQNFYSSFLFGFAFIMVGSVFSLFFWMLPALFRREEYYFIAKVGSTAGIIGGVFILGVGLTPGDIATAGHMIFATWFIRFFLIAAFCYSYVFYQSKLMETKYASGYALFTFLIAVYIVILEFGPSIQESLWALKVQVISQKIICLTFILAVAYQTVGNAKIQAISSE